MFKYCSFFGLSAPALLSLSKKDIDSLFNRQLSKDKGRLLENLLFEVYTLKNVLSSSNDIKTQVDDDSILVKKFLNGVNDYLEKRGNTSETLLEDNSDNSDDLSLDDLSLDDSDDLSLDDLTLEEPEENLTSLFSSDPASDELLLEDDSTDLLDISDDLDASDMLSDLEDLDLEDLETDDYDFNIIETQFPKSFVAIGDMREPDGMFKNIEQYSLWFITKAKNELNETEYASLAEQTKALPRKLSGTIVQDSKTYRLDDEHPLVYKLLNHLVLKAFEPLDDDNTKIEYLISIIEKSLQNSSKDSSLFFGVRYDVLSNLRSIYAYNIRINEPLCKGILSVPVKTVKSGLVDSMLTSCDTLLNPDKNDTIVNLVHSVTDGFEDTTEIYTTLTQHPSLVADTVEFTQYKSEIFQLIDFLKDNEMIETSLKDARDLVGICNIFIYTLKTYRNYFSVLGLDYSDVEDVHTLNKVGITLAKICKIGGVYSGVLSNFYETIQVSPKHLTQQDYSIKYPNDVDFNTSLNTEVQMVRTHLLSLKERLNYAES